MLLNMVAAFSAATAQSVRLVVLLSETRRSLRHDETKRAFLPRKSFYKIRFNNTKLKSFKKVNVDKNLLHHQRDYPSKSMVNELIRRNNLILTCASRLYISTRYISD